jgi:hypothetical protein
LNNHIYFGEATMKLKEVGFFLGIEEKLGLYNGIKIRYQTYIQPEQNVVLTLEESVNNEIGFCHLYGVWKLKPEVYPDNFFHNHPYCDGVGPNFVNTSTSIGYLDANTIHAPEIASTKFDQVWDIYSYYLNCVNFTKWEIQPDLTAILSKERLFNSHYIFTSEQRLLKNIEKLNIDPADFAIKV